MYLQARPGEVEDGSISGAGTKLVVAQNPNLAKFNDQNLAKSKKVLKLTRNPAV